MNKIFIPENLKVSRLHRSVFAFYIGPAIEMNFNGHFEDCVKTYFHDDFGYFIIDGVNSPKVIESEESLFFLWESIPSSGTFDSEKLSHDYLINLVHQGELSLFVTFNKRDKKINWYEGKWSKFNLNYLEKDGRFYITSDYLLFDKESCSLDLKSLKFFLLMGWLPPDRSIFKEILATKSESLYEYDFHKKSSFCEEFKKSPVSQNTTLLVDLFYQTLKKVVRDYVDYNNIEWISLTGGSDTRLILSALRNPKDHIFWIDIDDSSEEDALADFELFKSIVRGEGLKGAYLAREPNGKHKHCFSLDTGREILSPDEVNKIKTIAGHAGGEVFGGNIATLEGIQFLLDGHYIFADCQWGESLKNIDISQELKRYFDSKDELNDTVKFIQAFIKAPITSFHFDHFWIYPQRVMNCDRSFTPFTHPALLEILHSLPYRETHNYKFYRKVYKKYCSHYLKYPFQSRISDGHEFLKPELGLVPCTKQPIPAAKMATLQLTPNEYVISPDSKVLRRLKNLEFIMN